MEDNIMGREQVIDQWKYIKYEEEISRTLDHYSQRSFSQKIAKH